MPAVRALMQRVALVALCLLGPAVQGRAVVRTTHAARIHTEGPRIDGRLDEGVWSDTSVASDFVQREPAAGQPATQKTEARFLIDDEALYVGITAHDSEPGLADFRVTPRDRSEGSDWVAVDLDTFLDQLNGYRFGVTAAGVELDATLAADSEVDWSWDAAWEGAAARIPEGWSVEMRIPFQVLRHGPQPSWGLNVQRRIARLGETSTWSPVPRTQAGWMARSGHLLDMDLRASRPRFSVTPYGLERVHFFAGADPENRIRAGVDLRGTLAGGWTVLGTVNPDFGQIGPDPTVLNLGVFEVLYEERRPFFVESNPLYLTPYRLYFSRRIGMQPGEPELAPGEYAVARPESTTILEAVQLTGATGGGLRVGLLQALTQDEHAEVGTPGGSYRRLVKPMSHYLVARVERQLGGGSSLGLLGTSVDRRGGPAAWSGGFDWDLEWADRMYAVQGQLALSRALSEGVRETGLGLKLDARKDAGERLLGGLSLALESPNFEINDLGYLRRNDHVSSSAWAGLQWTEPGALTRQSYVDLRGWLEWNWSGLPLRRGFQLSTDNELYNLAWVGAGLSIGARSFDDLDTRGGPPIVSPARWDAWGYYSSDVSRSLWVSVDAALGADEEGGWDRGVGATLGLHPRDWLELQLRGSYWRGRDLAQWLENLDEDGDGQPDSFLYGELDSWILDLSVRASVRFTPRMSVDFAMQPYVAVGDYDNFKELARPRSFDFVPAELDWDPDFSLKSLNSNLVFRWELGPESNLLVIWNQSRFDDSRAGDFRPGRDLADLFTAPGSHVLAVKFSRQLDF